MQQPIEEGGRKALAEIGKQFPDRCDGHDHSALNGLRRIQHHLEQHSAAAVMANRLELLESELLHDLQLIPSHFPLRIGNMIRTSGRFAGISISPQICQHHGIFFCEVEATLCQATCDSGKP